MKKRYQFLAILLLAIWLLVLVTPVSLLAAPKTLIVDEMNVLTQSEKDNVNARAEQISAKYNMDAVFLLATGDYRAGSDLTAYSKAVYEKLNLSQNGFIMSFDEKNALWEFVAFGSAQGVIGEKVPYEWFDAFDKEKTYIAGISAYLDSVEAFLAANIGVPDTSGTTDTSEATDNSGTTDTSGATDSSGTPDTTNTPVPTTPGVRQLPRLVDSVGLLSPDQAVELTAKLDEISQRHQFDVVVAVVPELDEREARLFAADFFEQNGFGNGSNLDGAILLLATKERDFGFAAFGHGLRVFTPAGQKYLDKLFLPYLKKDQYFEAFMAYANGVDDFVAKANTGQPYDKGNIPKTAAEILKLRLIGVLVSLGVGLALAGGITSSWKRQLRSVYQEDSAHEYVRDDSIVLSQKYDTFVNNFVDKTARPKDNDRGGGSTFSSSSGSSATGHSGKY